jgi:hypothetical protein
MQRTFLAIERSRRAITIKATSVVSSHGVIVRA